MARDRLGWHSYFMRIAHEVATRSTCDRKAVGCVLVRDRRIISSGYNGSVPGADHCDEVGHDLVASGTGQNCVRTVHSEINAVAQAARHGVALDGASAYVNTFPCWPCFKVLVSAGITHIYFDDEYRVDERVTECARQSNIGLHGPVVWQPAAEPT